MNIQLPQLSLIVLIGPSGSGKSTFACKHFKPTEIISSDACRGLISDDENDQSASNDAFDLLHYIAAKRLARGLLTVIDATNVQASARKSLIELARKYHVLPAVIVLNMPERVCHERNRARPDRQFGAHVVRRQRSQLRRSLRGLKREGFRNITVLASPDEVVAVTIERTKLWNDLKHEHGPFDIIGDIHGCCDELETLLAELGYLYSETPAAFPGHYARTYHHPDARQVIFLGDLVDRGPRVLDTVQLVRNMVQAGHALCVPGNHDAKLVRKLRGRNVQVRHGLASTLAEIDALPDAVRESFSNEIGDFLYKLVSHYVLDDGKLVVAHAGLRAEMQGRASGKVRDFCLYGETTGETDEFGLPIRHNWAAEYRGNATVVYGHTPVPDPEWLNRTINIDTGAVFGGKLTALRYPEKALISVPAARVYAEPARPLIPAAEPAHTDTNLTAQQQDDALLDIDDVLGKHIVNTRLMPQITVNAENSSAALEVMSRFAVEQRWLIYLPPTMSPTATVPAASEYADWLEYPTTAFNYFRKAGVETVICEEKHMGSRAVAIVCKDDDVAARRFGVADGGAGIIYTRTGRRFFDNLAMEEALLAQIRAAWTAAGLWDELETDWVCLDCELMPWSVKAQELLRQQYAAVGAAAHGAMSATMHALDLAATTGAPIADLMARYRQRQQMTRDYASAYRPYCWPVASIADVRLAPFHILATEGTVHAGKDHDWHMKTIARFAQSDAAPSLQLTKYHVVNLADATSEAAATAWWLSLTQNGGEGMVIKPIDFVARGNRSLVQPAVKCRGRAYLRIIYGPEYTAPEHLERLRRRGLSAKRGLALREFSLGIEALERFVRGEPLRRVHECVFGVLALESAPVDPRL